MKNKLFCLLLLLSLSLTAGAQRLVCESKPIDIGNSEINVVKDKYGKPYAVIRVYAEGFDINSLAIRKDGLIDDIKRMSSYVELYITCTGWETTIDLSTSSNGDCPVRIKTQGDYSDENGEDYDVGRGRLYKLTVKLQQSNPTFFYITCGQYIQGLTHTGATLPGSRVSFDVDCPDGYTLDYVMIGNRKVVQSSTHYEFTMPSENVHILAHCTKSSSPIPQGQPSVGSGSGTTPSTSSAQTLPITVNGVSFNMIRVSGGTFSMGAQKDNQNGKNYDSEADSDEKPVHTVSVGDFYIGETEVTQGLWKAVMGDNPSYESRGIGDNLPVNYVSWNDCQEFIKKLNQKTDKTFRLPTEAEWEYAARGGNKSKGFKYSGSNIIGDVAWYDGNSNSKVHPVKSKTQNELGLYDMSGNVWEWCQDCWDGSANYNTTPRDGSANSSGSNRVLRGGSWFNRAWSCRSADRYYYDPDYRINSHGFRLALVP